jgi:hypothetical protein
MYPPHQVPDGSHYTYVFYDPTTSRFKIGESRNPIARRKKVAWEVLSWHLRRKLKEYHRWTFQNYYACIHVEQAFISLLKTSGFSPVRRPDWFEIDRATMDAAILCIDKLAKSITEWEKQNASTECVCYSGKPYGDYLHDTDGITRGVVIENDDGSIDHIEPDLPKAIADKKHFYQMTRKKPPDGLLRLIAAMDANPGKLSS